jgi:leucine dehydrogenase
MKNKRVAVNGLGKVGARTAAFCAGAGARLVVADINRELAEKVGAELGARVVDYTEIHKESCDIYSPCALGGAVSSSTVDDLNCDIICGGANNQLATPDMMDRLTEKGIIYVPDYLANAGGVILIGARGTDRGELEWYGPEIVGKLDYISDLTQEALRLAESQYAGNTARVADMMAERRLVTY